MTQEIWKEIPGYDNYMVSNKERWRVKNGKINDTKDNKPNNSGRMRIQIMYNNKPKSLIFARLVGSAFVENPENKPLIWHKDKNQLNNKPENLVWKTQKEINQLIDKPKIYTRTPVIRINKDTDEELEKYSSFNDAAKWVSENTSYENKETIQGAINSVCAGSRNTAYGFKWKYFEEKIEGEEWKKHPNIKGILCSNMGRVKDKNKIRQGYLDLEGYVKIKIKYKDYRVHRLIAETFLLNPNNLPQVDHINENKSDNRVCNLRWCTTKQNTEYACNKAVYQYSKDKKTFIKKFDSTKTASEELDINRSSICQCLTGKYKSGGEFYWSFHELDLE